ncbi:MAG: hypothetical protein SCARUB_02230 [Candidatus Scalindua rubra]|uniref:Uncharacterized protein n=1 Tax=Candidatus Scalindua rubra TaxID=1872076 RepID=A0A1E3XAL1_9BACT|nr:MAG: hypothetical protein SCARUB_02230 [Candidatus Scalindua rubra]
MNKTGYLEFKSFDVHFIYSFFMDFVKIDKTLKDVLDALNKDGNNWHKGRPEERRQVTMNLRVEKKWGENEYFSSIYKKEPGEIKGFSDKNLISNYETVDMDYEIVTRIFDTGAGTVNIKLGFKRKNGAFNSLDIHNIFNLADTGIQNSDVRIPSLTLFPDGKSEKGKKLFEIFFVECTSIEKVLKNISKSFNTTNEEETLWLDREFINMNMNKTDWQNPYVVTIGKLKEDSSSEKSLWWHYSLEDLRDKLETRKKYREAATLLFRFLIGREYISEGLQDDVYIPADLQGKDTFLRNFGWHRDIL